jgi:hypothetical protein
MIAKTLRATLRPWATALFLGTAVMAASSVPMAVPATAAVRSVVGKPLMEARNLAAAGNYSGAMAKVREAEGAGGLTGEEQKIISQMKEYIEVKSGGSGGEVTSGISAKAKFANDYRAGHYSAVIGDEDMLRKFGVLDGQSLQVIAQAYYLSGNKSGCVRFISSNFGSGAGEDTLALKMRCAYDTGDDDTMRGALEELVARTGKADYWAQLLKTSERMRGLSDHQTLDIYRIKLLTGSLSVAENYRTLAKLALELHFPAEAQAVEQKGFQAKLLSGDTDTRLMNMTNSQFGADKAGAGAAMAAANAAPNGDALVTLGENFWGQGRNADAIKAVQAGIAKGPTDKNNAQIRLGMAYLGAGQKDSAVHAFSQVKGDDKWEMIAHLWTLYARR